MKPIGAGPRILIVEDEPSIVDTIQFPLETDGCITESCGTGGEALCLLAKEKFDLVVLDVGLPDMTGFEVCRRIRTTSNVPILFLTARSEEIDRVVGLEIGGDDYVSKPFRPRELSARIRAILRRASLEEVHVYQTVPTESASQARQRSTAPAGSRALSIDQQRKVNRIRERASSVKINFTPNSRVIVIGDEFLLENAISNLLQNAIEFSPSIGTVTVLVERDGKTVQVRILDEGPGIPDYALTKIFDRFYSLARPSTGKRSSGLGLCFAREVAHLHHGEVTLRNRLDGSGAEAWLTLQTAAKRAADL